MGRLEILSDRKCGPCSTCCVSLEIQELDKPENVPCRHLKQRGTPGCARYTERPTPCQAFRCYWLDGEGPPEWRPDRSGIMTFIDRTHNLGQFAWTERGASLGGLLVAVETAPGAAETSGAAVIATTRKWTAVFLRHHDGRRVILAPPWWVRDVERHLEALQKLHSR